MSCHFRSGFEQAYLDRAEGWPTIPSTMGVEKKTNPFLRPDSWEIRKTLEMTNASDAEVFGEIRRRKDNF